MKEGLTQLKRRVLLSIKRKKKAESNIFVAFFIITVVIILIIYSEKNKMIDSENENVISAIEGAGLASVTLEQEEFEKRNERCICYLPERVESNDVYIAEPQTYSEDYNIWEAYIVWSQLNTDDLTWNLNTLPKKITTKAPTINAGISNNERNTVINYVRSIEDIFKTNIGSDKDGYIIGRDCRIKEMTIVNLVGPEAYQKLIYKSEFYTIDESDMSITWLTNKNGTSYSTGIEAVKEQYDYVSEHTAVEMGLDYRDYELLKYEYEKAEYKYNIDKLMSEDSERLYCYSDRGRACFYSDEDYFIAEDGTFVNAKEFIDNRVAILGNMSVDEAYLRQFSIVYKYEDGNLSKSIEENIDITKETAETDTVFYIAYRNPVSDEEKYKEVEIKNKVR